MINFKVKICGITNPTDAHQAVKSGASAIGLNFYSKSLRNIDLAKAQTIVNEIPGNVVRIGVFVNESTVRINKLADDLALDMIQLHGDESASIVAAIDRPVIRAIRVVNGDFNSVNSIAKNWQDIGATGILLDSGSPTEFGGTGKQLEWKRVAALELGLPIVLAGGLNGDNVAMAIASAKPDAVDVASGIEKFPGAKDHDLISRFVQSALAEFARLPR